MKKDFISRPSGSEKNEPKVIGEVLNKYFRSDSPFAVAYRNHLYPDTHFCVDVKVYSRTPGRMHVGDSIYCKLTRDSDEHFTAIENALKRKVAEQRNPIVFYGLRINVHRRADGTLYPTFNRPRYTKDFTFADFCREAAEELNFVAGLIEKG